jgi:hypothetical protein
MTFKINFSRRLSALQEGINANQTKKKLGQLLMGLLKCYFSAKVEDCNCKLM